MGCCKSCQYIGTVHYNPWESARVSRSFTKSEIIQLGVILSEIPVHYQETIFNLPARQLLKLYQYHLMGLYYGLEEDWLLAISYEQRAIKRLQDLIPYEKDHYIFFYFYNILSASFLALGEFQIAIEGIQITLAILLKHTPSDYKTISYHYYHLADAYKTIRQLQSALQYLEKAIETARLSDDQDEEYIDILQMEFQIINEQIDNDTYGKSKIM